MSSETLVRPARVNDLSAVLRLWRDRWDAAEHNRFNRGIDPLDGRIGWHASDRGNRWDDRWFRDRRMGRLAWQHLSTRGGAGIQTAGASHIDWSRRSARRCLTGAERVSALVEHDHRWAIDFWESLNNLGYEQDPGSRDTSQTVVAAKLVSARYARGQRSIRA